jgi:hypothetical protein
VHDGSDHDLVCTRALSECLEPRLHSGRGAHDVGGEDLRNVLLLSEGPLCWRPGFDLVGREQRTWGARQIVHSANVRRVVVALGNFAGLGADNYH